jgi:ribonuclease HI
MSKTIWYVKAYTDGGCSNEVGAYAYMIQQVLEEHNGLKTSLDNYTNAEPIVGGSFGTTNNRMELTAVSELLSHVLGIVEDRKKLDVDLEIVTDSKYVISCLTLWWKGWERNKWHTKEGEPVKNRDIIGDVLNKSTFIHKIKYTWVKGHDLDTYNNKVDAACTNYIKQLKDI